jgi:hypothetical protein
MYEAQIFLTLKFGELFAFNRDLIFPAMKIHVPIFWIVMPIYSAAGVTIQKTVA